MNKLFAALTIAIACTQVHAADTKCYIYVAGSCTIHGEVKTNQWFVDDYNGSGTQAGVCLHRASEYRAYCQMPSDKNQYVNAAFTLNGRTINAQQFRGGAEPQTTFGLDWSPIITAF